MRRAAEQVECAFIHSFIHSFIEKHGTGTGKKEYIEKKRVNPKKTYHRETGPILLVLKLKLILETDTDTDTDTDNSAVLMRHEDRKRK